MNGVIEMEFPHYKSTVVAVMICWLLILSSSIQAQQTTSELTISQNPFPDSTQITLHELDSDTVSLMVYDMTGNIVFHPYDSVVLTGTFTLTFDARAISHNLFILYFIKNGTNEYITKLQKGEPTSISQATSREPEVAIFPNPTSDLLHIRTSSVVEEVACYSFQGQQLFYVVLNQNTIDISQLPAGMYVMELSMKDHIYQQIIVKE